MKDINSISISGSGKQMVSGGGDDYITLWQYDNPNERMNPVGMLTGNTNSIFSLNWNSDSSMVVSSSIDKRILVYRV